METCKTDLSFSILKSKDNTYVYSVLPQSPPLVHDLGTKWRPRARDGKKPHWINSPSVKPNYLSLIPDPGHGQKKELTLSSMVASDLHTLLVVHMVNMHIHKQINKCKAI